MTRIIIMNRPGAVSSSCSCHSRAAGVTARSSPWTHPVQHTAAGEGAALTAPDAVLTVKINARHTDGGYELFEANGFDLGPGSSITIPPAALRTFTVLSPMAEIPGGNPYRRHGRLHADLDATVLHGRSIEETAQQIQQVLVATTWPWLALRLSDNFRRVDLPSTSPAPLIVAAYKLTRRERDVAQRLLAGLARKSIRAHPTRIPAAVLTDPRNASSAERVTARSF